MSRGTSNIVNDQIKLLTSARIPTRFGEFQLALYENSLDEKDHLALMHGDIHSADEVLVRVHSECFTGDVLGSLRCDCGEQLNASMRMIAEEGAGIVLYLRQEGRGIGLHDKLRAYNLQDQGYDTVDANLALGHEADERDYTIGALILRDLNIQSVRLLTNNPEKIESLESHGIDVGERVPLQPEPNMHNAEYLHTKLKRMRHMLDLGPTMSGPSSKPNVLGSRFGRLQRRLSSDDHTQNPFVTLLVHRRLDGQMMEPAATSVRVVMPVAINHDAIVAGPDQLDVLAEALDAQSRGPSHVIVLDPDRVAPARLCQRTTAVSPVTVFTTTEGAASLRTTPEAADFTVVGVDVEGAKGYVGSVFAWLKNHAVQSALVCGPRTWSRAVLRDQRVTYIIEFIDTASLRRGSTSGLSGAPFTIRKPTRFCTDKGLYISGEISYIEGE